MRRLLDRIKRRGANALMRAPSKSLGPMATVSRVAGKAVPWLEAGIPIAGAAYMAATDGVSDRGVGKGPVRATTGFLREVGDRVLSEDVRDGAVNALVDFASRPAERRLGLRRR